MIVSLELLWTVFTVSLLLAVGVILYGLVVILLDRRKVYWEHEGVLLELKKIPAENNGMCGCCHFQDLPKPYTHCPRNHSSQIMVCMEHEKDDSEICVWVVSEDG